MREGGVGDMCMQYSVLGMEWTVFIVVLRCVCASDDGIWSLECAGDGVSMSLAAGILWASSRRECPPAIDVAYKW